MNRNILLLIFLLIHALHCNVSVNDSLLFCLGNNFFSMDVTDILLFQWVSRWYFIKMCCEKYVSQISIKFLVCSQQNVMIQQHLSHLDAKLTKENSCDHNCCVLVWHPKTWMMLQLLLNKLLNRFSVWKTRYKVRKSCLLDVKITFHQLHYLSFIWYNPLLHFSIIY